MVGQQVSERTIEAVNAEFRRVDQPAFLTVKCVRVDGECNVVAVSTSIGHRGRTPRVSVPTAGSGKPN